MKRHLNTDTSTNYKLLSFTSSRFDDLKSTFFLLIASYIIHIFCAWQWPALNDETYYWDWARNLHLSYVDAPPAVSWLAFLNSKIFHHGHLQIRFFVPFLSFLTGLFLIQSAQLLAARSAEKNVSYFNLIVLFVAIPIFNLNGIVLMPDASLLFACAGSLYFALKVCKNVIHDRSIQLSLIYSVPLGLFIGLGIDSKYQAAPVALGLFFAIVCIRGVKNTFTRDFIFWILTIGCAMFAISPLILWNLKYNFASFQFQGQHGFADWTFNFQRFIIYLFGVFCILTPWYSYLFCKQIIQSIKRKNFFNSLECIPIFAFFSIFIFIGYAALGKKAQEHWITPAFLFIIPLVGVHWNNLTGHKKIWPYINIFSLGLISIVSMMIFTQPVQNILSQDKKIFGFPIKNIHNGLYHNFFWSDLKDPLNQLKKNIPHIENVEKKYIDDLNQINCSQEPYLASFSWRWTSQFAFYLPKQPRVFSFSFTHSSYYKWRDDLADLAGCRFFVIGSEFFDRQTLEKIMIIQSVKNFVIPQNYTEENIPMVIIEGTLKDKKTLTDIWKSILANVQY